MLESTGMWVHARRVRATTMRGRWSSRGPRLVVEVDPRGGVVAWTLFEMDEGSPPFRTAPLFGRDEEKRSKKGLLKHLRRLVGGARLASEHSHDLRPSIGRLR